MRILTVILFLGIIPELFADISLSDAQIPKEKLFIAPVEFPKQIYDTLLRVPILTADLKCPGESKVVDASYSIKSVSTGKIIRNFSGHYIVTENRKLILAWNPLAEPEKISSDNESFTISVKVSCEGKELFNAEYEITVGNACRNTKLLNEYIVKLKPEFPAKIEIDGLNMVPCFISESSGLEIGLWAMLGRKLAGGDVLNLRILWSSMKSGRDEYNWELLDRALSYGERLKLPIIVSFAYEPGSFPYWWFNDDYLAQPAEGYNIKMKLPHISYSSPAYRKEMLDSTREIIKWSQGRKIIVGWQFGGIGNCDGFYDDVPAWQLLLGQNSHYILDYSPHAQKAFGEFLKKRYESISKLNEAYGTNYSSFEEVPLPAPLWNELDRRQAWNDFTDFKIERPVSLQEEQFALIRKLDPDKTIISWGLKTGNLMPFLDVLKKYGVVLNYSVYGHVNLSVAGYLCNQAGVKCITEDADDVFKKDGTIDRFGPERKFFEMIISGVNGSMGMRPVYNSDVYPHVNKKWISVLKELTGASLAGPVLAVNCSPYSWLAKEKSFYCYYDRVGVKYPSTDKYSFVWLRRFLLEYGYNHQCIDSECEFDAGKYHTIIDADSTILPETAMNRLAAYVKDGGNLILSEFSGKYPRNEKSSINLCEQLGMLQDQPLDSLIHKYGKGTFSFLPQSFDWREKKFREFVISRLAELGVFRSVECENPDKLRLALLKKDGNYYIVGLNESSDSRILSLKPRLPDDLKTYTFEIVDLFNGSSIGYVDFSSLRKSGLEYPAAGKRAFVLKLIPQVNKNAE